QDTSFVDLPIRDHAYGMARPSTGVSYDASCYGLRRNGPMTITILGIDLGKTVCSIVGLDAAGAVVLRRRMRRQTVIKFASGLPPCIVALEACCGAHHLGHALSSPGHTIKLMSPEYVRPYVKAQKNDDRDAEAIAEAAT